MNRRDLLLGAGALASCGAQARPAARFPMRKAVNLGNALEAPNEGDWGYRIEPSHLDAIAKAGFDGVRLPVRWDPHLGTAPPFAIGPAFLARVDEVTSQALARGLYVQLDVHHYDALVAAPAAETARFLALWRQIAAPFAGAPARLLFEVLNEPNGAALAGARLARLQAQALAEIRRLHPERIVVLGGPNWNSIDGLTDWTPPADAHGAVSVHYYEPHNFTHENAEWLGADAPHFARAWATPSDLAVLERDAQHAAAWAEARGVSLQLGEFGVNRRLPTSQRALWTRAVRAAFESHDIGWCVWDFAGAFAIWDRQTRAFNSEMLRALFDAQ